MFKFNSSTTAPSSKVTNEAITTIIGEDLVVEGNLSSVASIRVDGKVIGNVEVQKLIIIGEKAQVTGNISTKKVIIFGHLNGNVNAAEVQIKKTGFVNGDINVEALEIEMGGKYNGNLIMNHVNQDEKKLTKKLLT